MSYAAAFDTDDVFAGAKGPPPQLSTLKKTGLPPGWSASPPTTKPPPTQVPPQGYAPPPGTATHHDFRFPNDALNGLMVTKLQRWVSQGGQQRQAAAQALAEVVPASGVLGALASLSGTDLRRPQDPLNFEAVVLGLRAYAQGRVSESRLEAVLSRRRARDAIRYFARRIV